MRITKIKILTGVVSLGIIAGSAIGYYNTHSNNFDSNIAVKQEAMLAAVDDKDLSTMASLIVKGKVLSISDTKWNTLDGKQPSTEAKFEDMQYKEVLIKPEYAYKGNANSVIKVKVYGGDYVQDGQKYEVWKDSAAQFSRDEDVIVFLAQDDSLFNKNNSNEHYVVFGQKQGKFTLSNDEVNNDIRKMRKKDIESAIEKYKNDEPTMKKGSGSI